MQKIISYQERKINVYIEGDGETLLFLHGWPTNSRLWKYQVEALKNNYRVITLDWLGFGKSEKFFGYRYTFTGNKEILDVLKEEVLEEDEKINIIAHDIGGPTAILWVSENQDWVKRLILLNTIIYPISSSLDKMSHFFFKIPLIKNLLVSNDGLNLLIRNLSKSGKKTINAHAREIISWHKDYYTPIRLKTILEPLELGKEDEIPLLEGKLQEMKVDKYLIIAEKDPLCFIHMKKLREENPEIPAFTIENCGHFIPVDQPDKLNEVLREILGS